MAPTMRGHLTAFLDQLERIGLEHDELYDTDVRERMAEVIERTLVEGAGPIDVPRSLGMFSEEGNARVQAALATYLGSALPLATELALDEAGRRDAVWDEGGGSSAGTSVDEFLGWPF